MQNAKKIRFIIKIKYSNYFQLHCKYYVPQINQFIFKQEVSI